MILGRMVATAVPRRRLSSASIPRGQWVAAVLRGQVPAAAVLRGQVPDTVRSNGRRRLHAAVIMSNHYAVLGLDPFATPKDIKAAYIVRARETHPDVDGGDPLTFDNVVTAHEVGNDNQPPLPLSPFSLGRHQR